MRKIACPNVTLFIVCYIMLTLSAQISWALSLRLSKILQDGGRQRLASVDPEQAQNWLNAARDVSNPGFQKRVCEGFPCVYSHLGTKAGRASLYRTLAGFIDDCLNNASCDPGRRKRSRIQALNIKMAKNHVISSGIQRRLKDVKISRTTAGGTRSKGS